MMTFKYTAALLLLFGFQCMLYASGIVNVQDFGAVGDGETDDAPAIREAMDAAIGAGPLYFPPGTYLINSSFNKELTGDLTVTGDRFGTILLFSGDNSVTISSPSVAPDRRFLREDAPRNSITVAVDDVEGIEPGDIASFHEPTVTETAWKYRTNHLSYVVSVSPEENILTIAHPLNFTFTTEAEGWVGIFRPLGRLEIDGVTLQVRDAERSNRPLLQCGHLKSLRLRNMRLIGNTDFSHRPVHLSGCIDGSVSNIYINRTQYSFLVNNSRNIRFNDIESYNSRHPVTPGTWNDGLYIDNLRGANNQGIMDSHPSFNIHYNNVHSGIEASLSNLRSVGGSVRNSAFTSLLEISSGAPYFQTVALVEPDIYGDYEFLMENVYWKADNPINIRNSGKVVLRNVRNINLEGEEVGVNVGSGVGRLVLENTKPGSIRTADVTVVGDNRLDAVQVSLAWRDAEGEEKHSEDGYILDFESNLLTRTQHDMRAHGRIIHGRTEDPLELKLRIYDNFTGNAVNQSFVYGILRLKAVMSHSNRGGFQILEHHYHFNHKRVSTRGLSFQAEPVYVSKPAGQPNATLEMTVSNPIQDDHTPGERRWFQVDLGLQSGRTNPQYRLYYEIELMGL